MVRGSQVALKHFIHDMETRTLVMELRWRAIKRWVPCGDMDRRLEIPHKVEYGFRTTPGNAYTIAVQSAFSVEPHNTIQLIRAYIFIIVFYIRIYLGSLLLVYIVGTITYIN